LARLARLCSFRLPRLSRLPELFRLFIMLADNTDNKCELLRCVLYCVAIIVQFFMSIVCSLFAAFCIADYAHTAMQGLDGLDGLDGFPEWLPAICRIFVFFFLAMNLHPVLFWQSIAWLDRLCCYKS